MQVKNVATTKCICCKTSEIEGKDFVAGHIISEYNGGKVEVDNLLPICQPCNSSMGVTNMEDYIRAHYPLNLDAFLARDYREPSNKLWAYFSKT